MQKELILKNGLKLLFVEERRSGVAALGLSVGAGTYYENDSQTGISHLLEHLIGRSNIDGLDFKEAVYKQGGILEASTSIFKTYYYLTCFEKNLNSLSDKFIQGIFSPKISKKDLNESKESIVSEMAYMEDVEPYKILRGMMWEDSKLSKSISGSKDSILPLTISDLENYHRNQYLEGGVCVVLLASELPGYLIKTLEQIPLKNTYADSNINTKVKTPSFRIFQERNLKSTITLSFPTRGFEGIGEGKHYFNLAATALSELYISDLGSKGLIYDESWIWNVFPKNGDFIIFLDEIDHSHLVPVLKEIVNLTGSWAKKPFSEKDFEIMKMHKVLDLKTHTSIFEKITLLTKNFSTSDESHTYEEAIKVYEQASLSTTISSFEKTLLTQKPFIVVSAGLDSENDIEEIEKYLEEYYKR